jgi:hypothetical protein
MRHHVVCADGDDPRDLTGEEHPPTAAPRWRGRALSTVTTVASITIEEVRGLARRSRIEVPIDIMIITATSAAIGMSSFWRRQKHGCGAGWRLIDAR